HLTLKLDRLALILDDRQPCLLPGIETAFKNIGLDLDSLRKLLAGRCGAATGTAMENHRSRITGIDRPETGHRSVPRSGDAFPRVPVIVPVVDEHRTLSDVTLRILRLDRNEAHRGPLLFSAVRARLPRASALCPTCFPGDGL